jgi:phosphoribosylaminoimidazole-succinocarboxamide synthase
VTIAIDNIACFDCVLPTPIPEKGILSTQLSAFWFRKTEGIIFSRVVDADSEELDWYYDDWCFDEYRGRVVIIKNNEPVPVIIRVRGFGTGLDLNEHEKWKNA